MTIVFNENDQLLLNSNSTQLTLIIKLSYLIIYTLIMISIICINL